MLCILMCELYFEKFMLPAMDFEIQGRTEPFIEGFLEDFE